ncbi:MAG: glycoside hydrolase family 130 protein [Flavisolibacter sp.]
MKVLLLVIFSLLLIQCNNSSHHAFENSDWKLIPFTKLDNVNPILLPDSTQLFYCPLQQKQIRWEEKDVFNPAAVIRNDTVFLLYRAEDNIGKYAGTSRIGLAWSIDGTHFTKNKTPVLFPGNDEQKKWEWEGGCEDPRVVQDDKGIYYMTYTAYDGDKARLLVASSSDLLHWTKYGPAFGSAYGGKYVNMWSKSGSVVSTYKNGTPEAARINGKYWMYWGDVNIWCASSEDLIHWTPILYKQNEQQESNLRHNAAEIPEIKTVLAPRKGKFDSDLIEPGPPAMLTDSGIVLLYNSRNIPTEGDPRLPEGTYAASQAFFDKDDPTHMKSRMENYFIKPDKPYEISGQVNHVCFIEGLVKYHNRWFLYYGTADSKIAVARK